MNDNEIDKLLNNLQDQSIPPADENAKKHAINLASNTFRQGFDNSSRLIDEAAKNAVKKPTSIWRKFMKFLTTPPKNRIDYQAFGTAAAVLAVVSIVSLSPSLFSPKEVTLTEEAVIDESDNLTSKDEALTAVSEEIVFLSNDALVSAEKQDKTPREKPEQKRKQVTLAQRTATPRNKSSKTPEVTLNSMPSSGSISMDYSTSPTPQINNREEFAKYESSSIQFVTDTPVSTFSIDVDTASYSLMRNQLTNGHFPKPQSVRVEELINYFGYDYPLPKQKSQPFSSSITVMESPWNVDKKLIHIGIKGYDIPTKEQADSNIVFLLDVSGSMNQANKLPLVKQSVNLLLNTLKPSDTVSIVVYAGAAGTVLAPTKVKEKAKILAAIRNLNAGGSTAGGAGIQLAYQLAEQNFNKEAVNRIILATDGDFNVGQQSNEDLKSLVERKRDSGVFLSVLGFGRGNYQDDMMQTLAQNGNGVAAYIDTLSEAKKVLVDQATSTLFTIAKDVKLQVEFNPTTVSDYRLVGYETRALKKEDFNNDKVDAGDIGAGHTVTAIYEITPKNAAQQSVDAPRYPDNKKTIVAPKNASEYGFLKIRYKLPKQSISQLIETPINTEESQGSSDAQFSVAVAGFGQLLANSKHTGELTLDDVIKSASNTKGEDPYGYRSEFIQLVRMAKVANY